MTRTGRAASRVWTPDEEAQLRAMYPDSSMAELVAVFGCTERQIYCKAARLGVKKSERFLNEVGGRLNGSQGRSTRFAPGITPWNKGKPFNAGGRSAETQFKAGNRPSKWNPIGHERVCDGYLQRKVTDTGVTRNDYRPVHHLVWLEAGREIPPGHALVFINRDRTDIRLDNLELVPRRELMRRNSVCNLPPELAYVVRLRGVLNRKINKRSKAGGK